MTHQYAFPTSPYTQQPVVYTTSSHSHQSHGGYPYGTPLRRTASAGHAYTSSPAYGYTAMTPSQGAQYLTVPSSHHRSRSHSRHHSGGHGHHGHGHGYTTTTSHPVAYTTATPVYVPSNTGHHRSHSRSHKHPSHSRARSQSRYANYPSNNDYYRGRTASVGDRVRQFFGIEPSSSSYYNSYGNQGRSRHNSLSGHNTTRTGPWMFGSTTRSYVDGHGRECDHRGRPIHRY